MMIRTPRKQEPYNWEIDRMNAVSIDDVRSATRNQEAVLLVRGKVFKAGASSW